MKLSSGTEKVVDVICEVGAFFTVILIVLMAINHAVGGAGFLPENIAKILGSVREIAILVVVGLAGLQFALKRGFVIFLIYAALVAAAVILLFFPGVLPL